MLRLTFILLMLFSVSACGSDDSTLIVVSSFPAQGQPGQGGASIVIASGNSEDSGKVDLTFEDGTEKTCDGEKLDETSFLVDEDCLNSK